MRHPHEGITMNHNDTIVWIFAAFALFFAIIALLKCYPSLKYNCQKSSPNTANKYSKADDSPTANGADNSRRKSVR